MKSFELIREKWAKTSPTKKMDTFAEWGQVGHGLRIAQESNLINTRPIVVREKLALAIETTAQHLREFKGGPTDQIAADLKRQAYAISLKEQKGQHLIDQVHALIPTHLLAR